jgi:hypothetical protein
MNDNDDKLAPIVALVVLGALIALTPAWKARAEPPQHIPQGVHGQGHAEYHDFYAQWHDKFGKSCCNGTDCRPTEHRTIGEKLQVKLDGEWVDVPPDKVLNISAPDMQSHVCAPPKEWGHPHGTIFCVVIGAGI